MEIIANKERQINSETYQSTVVRNRRTVCSVFIVTKLALTPNPLCRPGCPDPAIDRYRATGYYKLVGGDQNGMGAKLTTKTTALSRIRTTDLLITNEML